MLREANTEYFRELKKFWIVGNANFLLKYILGESDY